MLCSCFGPLLMYKWHICMHLCKCRVEFNKLKKHVTKLVTLIFPWKKICLLCGGTTADVYWCKRRSCWVNVPWTIASLDKYCLNINLPGCACLILRKTTKFLLSLLGLSSLDPADGFFSTMVFIQLWARSKKVFSALLCFFIKIRGKRSVSFFLFEQLLWRLGRGKVVFSILGSFVSLWQKILQMLRVVPPKVAFFCGNFSPGVTTLLASQDQAMHIPDATSVILRRTTLAAATF